MLTIEQNDFLTRVGPGQPAGELLRRYWHPIAVAQELTPESPTKFVRVLGEDLVLFLDRSGRAGLLADRCSHRGASLLYGRVEERGISCAYHGWLYDTEGRILETPPERNDAILRTVQQKAYPVQRFVGLFWAYMGPLPAPELPKYDVLMRRDGVQKVVVHPRLDSNWLQAMENSVDPAHLEILHQELIGRGRVPVSTTRGFTDDVESFEFYLTTYGIIKKRLYKNGLMDEHPIIFPNILRQGTGLQYRVPIDDTHTWHVHVRFEPNEDDSVVTGDAEPDVQYVPPYKDPADALHPLHQDAPRRGHRAGPHGVGDAGAHRQPLRREPELLGPRRRPLSARRQGEHREGPARRGPPRCRARAPRIHRHQAGRDHRRAEAVP